MNKKEKIAVVTTCQSDFEKYVRSQPKDMKHLFCKVTSLKHVDSSSYLKCVLLVESKNVTDFVINKVINISRLVENLSDKIVY